MQQTGVDVFRTQVVECRIDKRPFGKTETVSQQNRVDGEIRSLVPELWVALAAVTLVTQRTMSDCIGERFFQLRRLQLIHKRRVMDDLGTRVVAAVHSRVLATTIAGRFSPTC